MTRPRPLAKAFSHWLSPAFGVLPEAGLKELELRPDLDAVEALSVMPEACGQASAKRCGPDLEQRAF